jgi:hypothetical protein
MAAFVKSTYIHSNSTRHCIRHNIFVLVHHVYYYYLLFCPQGRTDLIALLNPMDWRLSVYFLWCDCRTTLRPLQLRLSKNTKHPSWRSRAEAASRNLFGTFVHPFTLKSKKSPENTSTHNMCMYMHIRHTFFNEILHFQFYLTILECVIV